MYGTSLKKKRLFVCGRSGGEPQIHEFDLVSEDRKIVGEIKSGKCSTTNCSLALVDCFYLSRLKARVRLMIFTDKELYEYFKNKSQGIVSNDIQVILVNVPTQEASISTC